MRKMMLMGLVLTGLIYALPVVVERIEYAGETENTQDMLSVHAETPELSMTDEQDVKITVQVDGTAREMALEDYVAGVVAAEIAPTFPTEALKAQAVAARTYAAYKLTAGRADAHPDADVCDDYHHCAAYLDLAAEASGRWGSEAGAYESAIVDAVRATRGQVVKYDGKPIIAVFCAAAGEKTEAAVDVWGSEVPYLQNVDSPGGADCPKYRGKVRFTAGEFRDKMAEAVPSADLTGAPGTWFAASERSPAGGIKTVRLGGVQVTGTDLRETLGLNSTNFTLEVTDDSITFLTTGYGHGVGLSQYGAKHLADAGKTYQDILTHYYVGTTVEKWKPSV